MPTETNPPPAGDLTAGQLRARLPGLSIRDEHRFKNRLQSGRGRRNLSSQQLAAIAADIARAEVRAANRLAVTPKLSYPEELPITARRDDLLAAIRDNQVVVIAGETGSGKTTQLPKLCLELGRGRRGLIGHTQPRRIAARAVAQRLAEELDTDVGDTVGFAVRFNDQVGDTSLVKLMTDGILLAEIGRDRMLRNYDTIIIDEAHERSLNIDFLLGYLRTLLPRRPDLKLIITSATIDPQRFASYFGAGIGSAPIIEVSGRGYPVDIWYRPVVDPDDPKADPDRDQITAICDAITELRRQPMGDVLVFLSGEREIRDTADALSAMNLPETEILPLYARLSAGEQHRVFAAHRGRRIVLSTNVAETSLTVPGIKYVIDAGTARISRYSNRTKVQLLPIEDISQASAAQRAGRCGRTSPGICIRLYSEDDFDARPGFTDPEILRTNLASVMLQMACLDLGPVADFGFIDPPDQRQITDGLALLSELGAFSSSGTLEPLGRRLAQLPLDPRLGRMVLEAENRGCVRDVLVLAAALSIADPRERPVEHQQKADALHARFTDQTSDFASYLNLWRHIREQQRQLSSNQFRRMCRSEFLNYLRIREWQDLFTQLRQIVKGMGVIVGEESTHAPDLQQIHRSMLAGLLSHIGLKEGPRGDYLGARGAKFAIFPGSGLFKKQPQFVMAAELVETSRLWGRVLAGIDAQWAEELAPELVKRTYSEPHWERRQGSAVALERVTLYGVALIAGRKVGYHRIDPVVSRELFIRHALVEGDWDTRHHFFARNRAVIDEVADLEERARRRDILVDDDTVYAFYDQRIPAEVVSARHFDQWWKKARHKQPQLLDLTAELLMRGNADVSAEAFPTTWSSGDFELGLSYRFEPGVETDGVTVTIPLPLLGDAAAAGLDWQVPGLRTELVTALLRGLAKPLRRLVVPIPDTAAELVARLPQNLNGTTASLTAVLSQELKTLRGLQISENDWNADSLPEHLKPTYRIVDADGTLLASGKDIAVLQRQFAAEVTRTLVAATQDVARADVTSWNFDDLARTVRADVGGHVMTGYPALVAEDSRIAIRVLENEISQRVSMRIGTRRLLLKALPAQAKRLRQELSPRERLALSQSPHASAAALLADCTEAAVDLLVAKAGGPVWNQHDFQALTAKIGADLPGATAEVFTATVGVLSDIGPVQLALQTIVPAALKPVHAEVSAQFTKLIYPGFVTDTGAQRLGDLRRYLRAMAQRLTDAPTNLARDRERQAQIDVVMRDLAELRQRLQQPVDPERIADIEWMIEELRVSLFAQRLGTPRPISVARIQAAMDELDPV